MADDANMKSHVGMYDKVIGVMKWGSIACFVLAAVVVWLIA